MNVRRPRRRTLGPPPSTCDFNRRKKTLRLPLPLAFVVFVALKAKKNRTFNRLSHPPRNVFGK